MHLPDPCLQPRDIASYPAAFGAFSNTTSVEIPSAVPKIGWSSARHPATIANERPHVAFWLRPTPAASAKPTRSSKDNRANYIETKGLPGPYRKLCPDRCPSQRPEPGPKPPMCLF